MFANSNGFKRTVISCSIAGMLFSQGAWAHTNSVGYENAGPGSVNFWYGSWHSGVDYTEGSMKLVGPGGFDVTTPFTMVVNTKPVGLVDGVTHFYSDGTQLIGEGGDDTYAWQGVNFTGLTAGEYTFTYIPIDNPTATWDPADSVILSSTVMLSADIVGGGAGFVPKSTSTSRGAAGALDRLNGGATGQMAGVISALEAMTPEQQTAALQKIAPETGAALGMATSQVVGGVLDAVAVRLEGVRAQGFTVSLADDLANGKPVMLAANGETSGLLSGDPSLRHSLWLKAFGALGDQDMKDGFAGYEAETGGMALGSDLLLANDWVVGAAFTFASTDVSMNDFRSGDSATIDSYQLTAYTSRDFGRWYLEGMAAYALQSYETARNTGMTGIAQGDFDGDVWGLRVGGGMPLALGSNYTVTPLAGLEYNRLSQDGYTETGAGALSMQIEGVSAERLRSLVGVKIGTEYLVKSYTLRPSVQVGWRHDFMNDGIDSTATFTGGGAAFTTAGQDLEKDTISVGVGVNVSKSDRFLLSVQLDTEQTSGYSAYAGQVVAQWKF